MAYLINNIENDQLALKIFRIFTQNFIIFYLLFIINYILFNLIMFNYHFIDILILIMPNYITIDNIIILLLISYYILYYSYKLNDIFKLKDKH